MGINKNKRGSNEINKTKLRVEQMKTKAEIKHNGRNENNNEYMKQMMG